VLRLFESLDFSLLLLSLHTVLASSHALPVSIGPQGN
jgi:hypothetical protein